MATRQNIGARAKHLKPRITLTASDYERLSGLARAAMNNMPDVASGLADEIDRAHVVAKGRHPIDVVCMGCEVQFRDDTTGKIQKVILVYPAEADISQGKISVLTPIGTALIGLRAGSSITWEMRDRRAQARCVKCSRPERCSSRANGSRAAGSRRAASRQRAS